MIIKIIDIIGEYCSQRTDAGQGKGGESIRSLILQEWEKEEKIEISFEGVKLATPSFIDEAFGKLTLNLSLDQLRNKLKFVNLDDETKDKINKSIDFRLKQKEENKNI